MAIVYHQTKLQNGDYVLNYNKLYHSAFVTIPHITKFCS